MADLFRVFVPWGVLLLLLSEGALLVGCYVVSAIVLNEADPRPWLFYEGGIVRIGLGVLTILFGLYFADLYVNIRIRSRVLLLQMLSLVMGGAFLFQAFLGYVDQNLIIPKWIMIIGSCLAFAGLFLWRYVYSNVILRAMAKQRILFVGDTPLIGEIARFLHDRPERGFLAAGYIGDDDAPISHEVTHLGTWSCLIGTAERLRPEIISVDVGDSQRRVPYADLLELRFRGYYLEDARTTFERTFGRVLVEGVNPTQLLFTGRLGPTPMTEKLQVAFSGVIAIIGTIITAPLMILTGLAVKLTSAGPVLFRQERVGRNGRNFTVYKFRSMYINVDNMTGPKENDPRITPLGRYLRKLRIDELPQFFNVLKGDMLIVGPRPEIPQFTEVFVEKIPLYRQRLCVKPGITGWAQINYKREEVLEDTIRKLGYDLYYLKNTSIALDLYIVFHTLKTMLLSKGAR